MDKARANSMSSSDRKEKNAATTKNYQRFWTRNAEDRRVAGIKKKVSEQITSTDKNAKNMYEGPTPGLEERAGKNRQAAAVSARKSALKKLAK